MASRSGTDMPSRNSVHEKDVTRSGNKGDVEGGENADGEGFGPGSRYAATLRERANKSLNRNAGPGRPSANDGVLPTPSQSVRKTGRI